MLTVRLHYAETLADVAALDAGLLAIPATTDLTIGAGGRLVDEALGHALADLARAEGFGGKVGEVLVLATLGKLPVARVALIGVGPANAISADVLRRASGALARRTGSTQRLATTLAQAHLLAPDGACTALDAVAAVVEGAELGLYRFTRHKSSGGAPATNGDGRAGAERGSLEELFLVLANEPSTAEQRAVAVACARARATILARDLSNEPANHLHPADLAAAASGAVENKGVSVRIYDVDELTQMGCGGILGVGQGASAPPRLVEMRYEPAEAVGRVALIGKGITFDSGGLSIKPADGMMTMKTDMSGAAALIGVCSVLQDLDVRVAVTAYLACAENMPSGTAMRPGDVIRMRSGTTVEVLNTDAEGRLVMADALALAAEQGPDAIIDVATLTGAIMVALGPRCTGVFANDQDLAEELLTAAERAGELSWQLPLIDAYRSDLDSDVADLKNIGSRYGGSITAALFLREFVSGCPWVHLDIAGSSRADSDDGEIRKGSTGTAVRTLLSWLAARSDGELTA